MPTYEVELSDGRSVSITGPREPTRDDIAAALSKYEAPDTTAQDLDELEAMPEPANRFGETRSDLETQMQVARQDAALGKFAETAADIGERISYTAADALARADLTGVAANILARQGVQRTPSLINPEVARQDVDTISQFISEGLHVPPRAPEGSVAQLAEGAKEFGAEMTSGMTDVPLIGGLAAAKKVPQAAKIVSRIIQGQMLSGIPGATESVFEARNLAEATKGVLNVGSTFGFPLLIEAQLRKSAQALPRAAQAARDVTTEKGVTDASSIPETAEVYGDVRPQPVEGERQVSVEEGRPRVQPQAERVAEKAQVSLTPEEQSYLDLEREGLGVNVDVTENLPSGEPFGANISTIDRANNRILVSPSNFSTWLQRIPENKRAKAVRSLLSEERIHLSTDDASALNYWNTLTAAEKLINQRRYTESWRGVQPGTEMPLDETLLGHEALRFRMQQLARITPREIAETTWLSREGFTVRSITAIESAIRGLRESLGTKASIEAKSILDRIQGNLDVAKVVLAGGAQPSALLKGKRIPKEQEELILPDVPQRTLAPVEQSVEQSAREKALLQVSPTTAQAEQQVLPTVPRGGAARISEAARVRQAGLALPEVPRGSTVERGGFAAPKATDIEGIARRHMEESLNAGELPDFESFRSKLGAQYGSLPRESLYYAYQDALMKNLLTAKGSQVQELLGKVGAYRDVAQALKPGESAPKLGGPIPDAPIFTRGQQIIMPELGRISKAQYARQMMPEQRYRNAAIGAIIDKVMQKAGPKPDKPWTRTDIGPEDIRQRFTAINPPTKAEVEKIGVENIERPEVQSSPMFRTIRPEEAANPAALGDMITTGAAVEASGKGAPPRTVSRNLVALKDASGRVVLVSTWRDPRTGPKVTNPTASNLPGMKVDANLLKNWTPTVVMSLREPVQGFRRVFQSQEAFDQYFGDIGIEGREGVGEIPGAGRTEVPQIIPEQGFVSPTAKELTLPIRRLPPTVVPGETLPKGPGPEPKLPLPKPPEMLPGPVPESLGIEAASVFKAPSYGKPTGRIVEIGKPEKLQPGSYHRMGVQPELGKRMPAAPLKQALQAQHQGLKDAWKAMIARRSVKADLPRMLDAAEGLARQFAMGARQHIIATSHKDLAAGLSKPALKAALQANAAEALKVRAAAKAIIAAGKLDKNGKWYPDKAELAAFEKLLGIAEAKAQNMAAAINPLKKEMGRKWEAAVKKLQAEVEYARKHWGEPELMRTARAVRQEFIDTITFENQNGSTVKMRENYIPGRYEGEFWNDNSIVFAGRRMLGSAYRLPKRFANYYQAAAYGPYIPASFDVADLVENRVATGHRMVERRMWLDGMKYITDPDSKGPIGVDPVPIIGDRKIKDQSTGLTHQVKMIEGWQVPSPEYELVYMSKNKRDTPVAVRRGFEPLVRALIAPSYIEEAIPGGKDLLRVNGMLKHGVILLIDTFHPGRLTQFYAALTGLKAPSPKAAWTALSIRPADMPAAVSRGLVSAEQAKWATERIDIGGTKMSRQEVLARLVGEGLNVAKLSDALYKDAIQNVPIIGGRYHKIIAPYNNWLFQHYIPGLMAESAVRNVEKFAANNPNLSKTRLFADVAKDINTTFGNMGRQGIFKRKTFQDLMQLLFLAPVWQEGLIMKEIKGYARLAGAAAKGVGINIPYRKGLPTAGALGTAMGKGLATYFLATQIINLITRGQFTFQNEEEGHKLDAWIPIGKGRGLWLSPLSVFAEITHDIIRLFETKDRNWDAIRQMGENRLGPYGKLGVIALTGKSPLGQYYSTTPGVAWGAASQVVPLAGASPISLSAPTRWAMSKVFPNQVSPPTPGTLQRQFVAAAAGTKVEVSQLPAQQIGRMAKRFMVDNKLDKTTGWTQQMTDEPSYAKLRTAVRNDDYPEAKKQYNELLKDNKRTPSQILQRMSAAYRRPFTGSNSAERMFKMSLTAKDQELYAAAQMQRMEELAKFTGFFYRMAEEGK